MIKLLPATLDSELAHMPHAIMLLSVPFGRLVEAGLPGNFKQADTKQI